MLTREHHFRQETSTDLGIDLRLIRLVAKGDLENRTPFLQALLLVSKLRRMPAGFRIDNRQSEYYGGGGMKIEVEREADGRWIADVVDLPGVMTYGQTREDALARVKALALRVLADRLEHGETIPEKDL